MIDIGVASPSAHGQAMISTATALTSAWAKPGLGAEEAQATNVMTATSDHGRARSTPATRSASRWIGARLRWASPTMRTICASSVSAADALGAHHEAARAVDGAADDAGSRRLSRPASARR